MRQGLSFLPRVRLCARGFAFVILMSGLVARATGSGFAGDFAVWYQANSGRGLGSHCSAELAWHEAHLLQSCLAMFQATGDMVWLDRFTFHADTMLAVAVDAPADIGWSGYSDGFKGWGTARYDRQSRYQEYLVHDASIGLPLLRFARLVFVEPALQPALLERARNYTAAVERDVIAKWHSNWSARRGDGEELEHFGGWRNLPCNQFLAFGELLLLARELRCSSFHPGPDPRVPDDFLLTVPDSMARVLKAGLRLDPARGAYKWNHFPVTRPETRPEDLAHANAVISFVVEAGQQGLVFTVADMGRFKRALTSVAWNGSFDEVQFSRFVDGSGPADSVLALFDWIRLDRAAVPIGAALRQRHGAENPATMNAGMARTTALLAWDEARTDSESDTRAPATRPDSLLSVAPAVFRSATTVRYHVGAAGPVRIAVHDPSGRLVRVLVAGQRAAGWHQVAWRGRDEAGRSVPAGAYVCRLAYGSRAAACRLAFLP